jgi:acetyltransferase-like isoleucine patch superfamily enzyme
MGDFSSLSSGVKIWCSSNDFVNDLVMIAVPGLELEGVHPIEGDVVMENYTGVGANAVVMPRTVIPQGTVVGSLSLVPAGADLRPWSVYAGIPVRYIRPRNRDNVLRQVEQVRRWLEAHKSDE